MLKQKLQCLKVCALALIDDEMEATKVLLARPQSSTSDCSNPQTTVLIPNTVSNKFTHGLTGTLKNVQFMNTSVQVRIIKSKYNQTASLIAYNSFS